MANFHCRRVVILHRNVVNKYILLLELHFHIWSWISKKHKNGYSLFRRKAVKWRPVNSGPVEEALVLNGHCSINFLTKKVKPKSK